MTTSITHTPEQEAAIRFYRKRHNTQHGTALTNGQYADLIVLNTFNGMVDSMNADRNSNEIMEAFKAANDATKASVRTALGIQEP